MALLPRKRRGQKRVDQFVRQVRPNDLRSNAKHVHIVVLDTLVRRVRVVANSGPNATQLRGCDARANAAPADYDPSISPALLNFLTAANREIRIVVSGVQSMAIESQYAANGSIVPA